MKNIPMKNMFLLFLSIAFLSCNGPKNITNQEKDTTSFLNNQWKLTSITCASLDGISEKQIPFIEINTETKTFSGNDGCNQISGTITLLNNSEISFGSIMGTKMACMDMKIPDQFHKSLAEVKSYKTLNVHRVGGAGAKSETKLILYNEENESVLSFTN